MYLFTSLRYIVILFVLFHTLFLWWILRLKGVHFTEIASDLVRHAWHFVLRLELHWVTLVVVVLVEPLAVEPSAGTRRGPYTIGKRNTVATSGGIKLESQLVTHLTTTLTSTKLSAVLEPGIQVNSYALVVQLRVPEILHRIQRFLRRVIYDEAEPTRSELEPVQPHNNPLYKPTLAEQLIYLLLRSVE